MALRLGALYDALKLGSIPDAAARAAAEEVANYEARIAQLDSQVRVLTWMVGANIGLTLLTLGATLGVLFRLAAPS